MMESHQENLKLTVIVGMTRVPLPLAFATNEDVSWWQKHIQIHKPKYSCLAKNSCELGNHTSIISGMGESFKTGTNMKVVIVEQRQSTDSSLMLKIRELVSQLTGNGITRHAQCKHAERLQRPKVWNLERNYFPTSKDKMETYQVVVQRLCDESGCQDV